VAGMPEDMLVEAHGTFATATCQTCYKSYKGEDIKVSHTVLIKEKYPVLYFNWDWISREKKRSKINKYHLMLFLIICHS